VCTTATDSGLLLHCVNVPISTRTCIGIWPTPTGHYYTYQDVIFGEFRDPVNSSLWWSSKIGWLCRKMVRAVVVIVGRVDTLGKCRQLTKYANACCREGLVRTAFQSLQLIVTDFLPTMPCTCLAVCVDVTAKFGLQCQDLNISLTAVGLLVRNCIFSGCWLYFLNSVSNCLNTVHWWCQGIQVIQKNPTTAIPKVFLGRALADPL